MTMKNLPTLKGVFPEPKTQPKRDFLRENKLKLKSLQKMNLRHLHECGSEVDFTGSRKCLNSRQTTQATPSILSKRVNSGCSCVSKKTTFQSTKQLPRKAFSDKSIQTDDIVDEEFLTDALQKCSLNHVNNNLELHLPRNNSLSNIHEEEEQQNDIPDTNFSRTTNTDNDNDDLSTVISRQKACCNHANFEEQPSVPNKVTKTFYNKNVEPLDSGTRKQIKIPKYLEREKREKELKRLRELARDPNCPIGHYVLSEDEKKEALAAAEKEFRKLVDELNRMPMTTETLRVRNRKVEIEKTLADLENTIRTFSKQKVYVKIND